MVLAVLITVLGTRGYPHRAAGDPLRHRPRHRAGDGPSSTAMAISWAVLLVWWFSAGIRIQLTNWIGQQVLRDLRRRSFSHIQYLSFNFFDQRSAGSILVRIINDVNALQELFTNGVVNVLMDVLILTGIIAIMISIHPGLAFASMVVLPVMMLLSTEDPPQDPAGLARGADPPLPHQLPPE